mgnify:CR=1 FL=1
MTSRIPAGQYSCTSPSLSPASWAARVSVVSLQPSKAALGRAASTSASRARWAREGAVFCAFAVMAVYLVRSGPDVTGRFAALYAGQGLPDPVYRPPLLEAIRRGRWSHAALWFA